MQNSKQVIFIHIPKTGGTSIRNAMHSQHKHFFVHAQLPLYRGHTPLFLLDSMINLNNFHKISVVRNPFKRTFSLYKNFCLVVKNYLLKNSAISFDEFLYNLRFNGSFSAPVSINTPNHSFDQSFYITDNSGIIGVDKLYKNENLSELEKNFNISLQKLNIGDYDINEYLSSYTKQNITLVKYLYARDFEMFEYSKNFDDSLNNIF